MKIGGGGGGGGGAFPCLIDMHEDINFLFQMRELFPFVLNAENKVSRLL